MRQSCPLGLTTSDLVELFDNDEVELARFNHWMVGQTMTICNGKEGHHGRFHNEDCMTDGIGYFSHEKAHKLGDPFTWRCGYTGEFWETDDECRDNPHGAVVYRWDVERFLAGLPVID